MGSFDNLVPLIDKDYTPEKAEQFKRKLMATLDKMQADLKVERHDLAVLCNPETTKWLGKETSAWGPVMWLIRPQINKGNFYVMRVVDIPAELRVAP